MSLHMPRRCGLEAQYRPELFSGARSVKIQEDIDLVAGDFNGARWRRIVGADQHPQRRDVYGRNGVICNQ